MIITATAAIINNNSSNNYNDNDSNNISDDSNSNNSDSYDSNKYNVTNSENTKMKGKIQQKIKDVNRHSEIIVLNAIEYDVTYTMDGFQNISNIYTKMIEL